MKPDIELLLEGVEKAQRGSPDLRYVLPGSGYGVMQGKIGHYLRMTLIVAGSGKDALLDLDQERGDWLPAVVALLDWAKKERAYATVD